VDYFLESIDAVDGDPLALIVPHAGYIYSGGVAAYGFKQLEGKDYKVAVIIAADHQLPLSDPISIWAEGGFETPLGVVPVDTNLASRLVAFDPLIKSDTEAHLGEHPIEIELPFLQRTCPECQIIPILMSSEDEESIEALSRALISLLPGRNAVVIASSDLSHYPTYQEAKRVDTAILSAIETGNPELVVETVEATMQEDIPNLITCACGLGPIQVIMRVAQGLGANTISVLNYANSGDSPYGDKGQVVGYGAVMFWQYQPPDLTKLKPKLLSIARQALRGYLSNKQIPTIDINDPQLLRLAGAFVTLKKDRELRGCIGHLRADMPLYQVVQEMAISAATSDVRFSPLTEEDLDKVKIEISILSPMKRIMDIKQIELGTHGLVIVKNGRQGVFLPQVPVEQGWNREEYLQNLCSKASLPPGCWVEDALLYTFTAIVFGED